MNNIQLTKRQALNLGFILEDFIWIKSQEVKKAQEKNLDYDHWADLEARKNQAKELLNILQNEIGEIITRKEIINKL